MLNLRKSLLIIIICTGCAQEKGTGEFSDLRDADLKAGVIYGSDGRQDLYQVQSSALLSLADSTVALINVSQLNSSSGTIRIQGSLFGQSHSLCASEPYREQETAAFCSGFLVAQDTIVTAGHCIQNASDCGTVRFVFGYGIKQAGVLPLQVSSSEVYGCAQVVKTQHPATAADFAVIKLDRPVVGHQPLALRKTGSVKVGDPLVVIGHPAGLPTKVANGGAVRSIASEFFVANLDTYGGNSGSAVFNSTTGEVEGVLVRGENDFVVQGSCYVSNRCTEGACRGEDVTMIRNVLPFLTTSSPTSPPTPVPPITDVTFASASKLNIPDNSIKGIESSVTAVEIPNGRKILVTVDITHTYRGDLKIDLIAPNGTTVTLFSRSGGSADHVRGTFGGDLTPFQNLDVLSNISQIGNWKLKVYDLASKDVGVLNSWKLTFKR